LAGDGGLHLRRLQRRNIPGGRCPGYVISLTSVRPNAVEQTHRSITALSALRLPDLLENVILLTVRPACLLSEDYTYATKQRFAAARGRVNAGAIRRIPNSRRLPQWKTGSIHLIQDSIRESISPLRRS
jgi:hypothetical protein